MLAYVFWHWPRNTVDTNSYKLDLIQFHQTLQANKPAGFQRSIVFLINNATWLPTQSAAYEEWYLLDDSAAMDRINYAAVNGACELPHNQVAKNAAGGVGGLYRLRLGKESLNTARFAMWLAKPDGVSYREFDQQISALTSPSLWSRQMTLGPTREFCLHTVAEPTVPSNLQPLTLPLTHVWLGQS